MEWTACIILLALTCMSSWAPAEDTGEWVYGGSAKTDIAVWEALFSSDEAFYDGFMYVPQMLLAADDETEAWLVSYSRQGDEPSETPPTDGYLVMYIQLVPSPKVIGTIPVGTAPKETEPECEIKLLLDHERVLDEEHMLAEDILKAFRIEDEPQRIDAIYLDTPERDYLQAGWINRIRVKAGKTKYTLTYKKRYPIEGDDIGTALAAARADGFSLYDSQFPAEIDWGYAKMTLSFAADIDVTVKETPDLGLMDQRDAVRMFTEKMPSEVKDWGSADWGTEHAEGMQMIGPIRFFRYSGTLNDESVRIEVWHVPGTDGTQYIVECSKECENMKAAARLRDSMLESLDAMGILVPSDALKTQMILSTPDREP